MGNGSGTLAVPEFVGQQTAIGIQIIR